MTDARAVGVLPQGRSHNALQCSDYRAGLDPYLGFTADPRKKEEREEREKKRKRKERKRREREERKEEGVSS